MEQHTHAVVLDLREYLLADDLLDNQRYSYDDGWLDASECLGDDGWTRDAGEIEDVAALDEFEDKFKRHAVHVGHRQDTDDRISRLNLLTQYVLCKICIAPECSVWNHYSLGETGSSAGIIDHSQLIRILVHIVVDMVFAEVLRILDTVFDKSSVAFMAVINRSLASGIKNTAEKMTIIHTRIFNSLFVSIMKCMKGLNA